MLTRIYGTAFLDAKDLDAHLERARAGARARPPPARAASSTSSSFDEAPGMPFWLPNGMVARATDRGGGARAARKRGYDEIKTPQMLDVELWHRSGHWDNYRENMFFIGRCEGAAQFALKPMNCPGACLVFAADRHSYRELPLRSPSSGTSTATSARACCTACSACAPSPRTTPTSSARLDQVHRRGRRDLRRDRRALRAVRLRRRARRALDPAREVDRQPTSSGSGPRRRCARRSSARAASTS